MADGIFVGTMRAIEAWMDDDGGVDLIGVGKTFIVFTFGIVLFGAMVILPLGFCASRGEQSAESKCINGGGAWGIVGYHHSVKPIGTFPDYGCILLNRAVEVPRP